MKAPAVGAILHVRSEHLYGKLIRRAMDRMQSRWCMINKREFIPTWGNHDAIVVPRPESPYGVGVGEALVSQGCTVTPWEQYVEEIYAGKTQVRVFIPMIPCTLSEMRDAAGTYLACIKGRPYDKLAIVKLWIKSLGQDFSETIRDWEWPLWCTQAVHEAYMLKSKPRNLWQTEWPTPLTTEQVAGQRAARAGKTTTLYEVARYTKTGVTQVNSW